MLTISRALLAGGVTAALIAIPMQASAVGAPAGAVQAQAPAAVVATSVAAKYANCAALNKKYPHGVAKAKTVRDKTKGKRVTTFKVNKAVYLANKGKDRDKDGIACEKR